MEKFKEKGAWLKRPCACTDELLGGTDGEGKRSNPSDVIVVQKDSDLGELVMEYTSMDKRMQGRLLGYAAAMQELKSR